jgi:UDP-sugar transporter A1/2/3
MAAARHRLRAAAAAFLRAWGWPAALVLTVCFRSILAKMARASGASYDDTSVVMLTEVAKLSVALALWLALRSRDVPVAKEFDRHVALLYAFPALLYSLQNISVLKALQTLDAPTFELFTNMKTVTTTIVHSLFMRKAYTNVQWTAVFLLSLGTWLAQINLDSASSGAAAGGSGSSLDGFLLCFLYSCISPVAGVFTEYMLKERQSQSIHLQNVEMYAWGVVAALLANAFGQGAAWPERGLTAGFTWLTWLMVANGAAMGIVVSFVMKHQDNIVKVIAAGCALFLTSFLSYLFFDFHLSRLLLIGFAIAVCSIYLYFGAHNQLLAKAAAAAAAVHSGGGGGVGSAGSSSGAALDAVVVRAAKGDAAK